MTTTTGIPSTTQSWLAAAIASFDEGRAMFGVRNLAVVAEAATPEVATVGAFAPLESDRHLIHVGVVVAAADAAALAALLLGDTAGATRDDLRDAIREIANITGGGVKTRMLPHHPRLLLGLPFFVDGVVERGGAEHTCAHLRVDGLDLWLCVELQPHGDEKRRRIELESELAAQREQLDAILCAAGDGIVTVAVDGVIGRANPAAARLLGRPVEALTGAAIADVLPDWERLDAALQGRDRAVDEATLSHAHGTVVLEVSASHTNIRGAEQTIAVLRDITDRRALEQELRDAQKQEAIGRLAAGLAHEINTPAQFAGDSLDFATGAWRDLLALLDVHRAAVAELADARAHADVAARLRDAVVAADLDFLREHTDEACRRTRDGLDRIVAIVAALRSFTAPRSAGTAPESVGEILRIALLACAQECRGAGEVVVDVPDLPPVDCHRGELGQAFAALLHNAAQAIADAGRSGRGRIAVRARRDGDRVEVAVADDGCGIPEPIRDRIFDPFFTTRGEGRGRGHGLTTARAAIERCGGTISVVSAAGAGATFTVRLPCAGAAVTACAP